jgi:rsbT co-antagonist protein RsbR
MVQGGIIMVDIVNFDERIENLEDILASASMGDFDEIEIINDDALASIEMGLNMVLSDLKKQIEKNAELIERQRETIQTLSTPVITIWDGILTLPVIGVVDSRRTEEMMESLLTRVVETQSKSVIIDITGVDVVDTKTADHFLKMVKAVRLLGADCIITGISPDIAQTITNIGVDMSNIKTLRSLDQGLQEALKYMGIEFRHTGRS